jgi:hypothetical protein
MGEGRERIERGDITRGLKLMSDAMWLLFFGCCLLHFGSLP